MQKRSFFIAAVLAVTSAFGIFTSDGARMPGPAAAADGAADVAGNISTRPMPTPRKARKGGSPRAASSQRDLIFLDKFDGTRLEKTEADWKTLLTPAEYYVLRREGTERPYTGKLTDEHRSGTFHCAACGLAVFSSNAKFDSGTGWPSFYQPIAKDNVAERIDDALGERRTEIECSRCGSHLGHVFDDGPEPTGLRYCINSVALRFKAAK